MPRHTGMSSTSLTPASDLATLTTMNPESADKSPPATEERRLASILRRIELGDTSVTDLVYWLQSHEDFVTRKREVKPK